MTHATPSSQRIGLESALENINNHQRFLTSQTQPGIISAVNNAHLREDMRGGLCLEPCLSLRGEVSAPPWAGGKVYFPSSSWRGNYLLH